MADETCTIKVPIVAFRRAINAVRVHAERTKTGDEINAYGRVRLTAAADELLIAATNGTTSALAAVPILEDSRAVRFAADDGVFSVDLLPLHGADLVAGLRLQRGDFDEGDQVADLVISTASMSVRDVSGLWPGSVTTRPTLPFATDFPNVVEVLSKALAESGQSQVAKPLVTGPGVLALFNAAAREYAEPLQVETTGDKRSRGFLVFCGPSFIGSVSSRHNDDDSLARRSAWRQTHLVRLGLAEPDPGLDFTLGAPATPSHLELVDA